MFVEQTTHFTDSDGSFGFGKEAALASLLADAQKTAFPLCRTSSVSQHAVLATQHSFLGLNGLVFDPMTDWFQRFRTFSVSQHAVLLKSN